MQLSRPARWRSPAYADEAERRALAERLERAGDPRGRFMRAQLELAQRGPRPSARTYAYLCDEQRALALHMDGWNEAFGLLPHELDWFRGAPDELSLTWARYAELGGEQLLRRIAPRALSLSVEDDEDQPIASLAASPALAGIEELTLYDVDAEAALALGSSPHLGALRVLHLRTTAAGVRALSRGRGLDGLEELHLSGDALEAGDAAALAGASWFPRLRALRLGGSEQGDAVVEALVAAPRAPRLRSLGLPFHALSGEGVARLAAWSALRGVATLDLQANALSDEDVAMLLCARPWSSLRELWLGPDRLSGGAIDALAAWPGLPRLTFLDVDDADEASRRAQLEALARKSSFGRFRKLHLTGSLTRDDMAVLAQWPALARIEELVLWGLGLHGRSSEDDRSALSVLAQSPHLGALRSLEVGHAHVGAAGVVALLDGQNLPSLRALWLHTCGADDAVAAIIAGSPGAPGLERLRLEEGRVTSEGAAVLSRAAGLRNLRLLSLRDNHVGSPGALALASSPHLGSLRALCLHDNPIEAEGAEALVRSRAWPRLRYLELTNSGLGVADATALALALAKAKAKAVSPSDAHVALGSLTFELPPRSELLEAGLTSLLDPGSSAYVEDLPFAPARGRRRGR